MTTENEQVERHEEFHVTVEGINPIDWYTFCHEQGVKPLYIELNNMNLQLMCELGQEYLTLAPNGVYTDFTDAFCETYPDARIVREKLEVNVMSEDERPVYFECHIKIDGPMLGNMPMASRDLYRGNRWYVTKRSPNPFSGEEFYRNILKRMEHRSNQKVVGFEYEVCVRDTNASIDTGWAR